MSDSRGGSINQDDHKDPANTLSTTSQEDKASQPSPESIPTDGSAEQQQKSADKQEPYEEQDQEPGKESQSPEGSNDLQGDSPESTSDGRINKKSQTSPTSSITSQRSSSDVHKPEQVENDESEEGESSHSPSDTFHPQRLNDVEDKVPEEVTPRHTELEVELVSSVQQIHKPTPSDYANLEQRESMQAYEDPDQDEDEDDDQDADIDAGETETFPNDADEITALRQSMRQSSTRQSKVQTKNQLRLQKIQKFIYNNEDNTYCHRTLTNWCALFTYYLSIIIIFFGVFFIYIMSFVLRDRAGSAAILKHSIMEFPNPALAIVPYDTKTKSNTIIWYKSSGSEKNKKPQEYVNDISRLLEDHDLICHQQKLLKKHCYFDIDNFGPCAKPGYGYDTKKPCIFLKLNNLITWMPAPIPKDAKLPSEISEKMVSLIRSEAPRHGVYVDCRGATLYDQQNLGKLTYYPEPAYDIKYFPATKDTHTNPLIALHLSEIKSGRIVQLHCTLLAGNIKDKANSNIKLTVYLD